MKKKSGRYWLFSFERNNPSGGMNDYRFSFNNLEEFENEVLELIGYQEFQILDTKTNFHISDDLGTVVKWVCKNIEDDSYKESY